MAVGLDKMCPLNMMQPSLDFKVFTLSIQGVKSKKLAK